MIAATCRACGDEYFVNHAPYCPVEGYCSPARGTIRCVTCEVHDLKARVDKLERDYDAQGLGLMKHVPDPQDWCRCNHRRGIHEGPCGVGYCYAEDLLVAGTGEWTKCDCPWFVLAVPLEEGPGEPQPAQVPRSPSGVGTDMDPTDSTEVNPLDDE